MEIDLTNLHNHVVEEIHESDTVEIPKEYYENTSIVRLNPVSYDINISLDEEEKDQVFAKIKGSMILHDSISFEEIEYPFSIEYDDILEENCKKNENLLDILMFLWENIVLEVPLQFTKVSDLSKFHGDGWRLISEDEHRYQSNPFSDLLKDYDKE